MSRLSYSPAQTAQNCHSAFLGQDNWLMPLLCQWRFSILKEQYSHLRIDMGVEPILRWLLLDICFQLIIA
jgi:hypothetical protein